MTTAIVNNRVYVSCTGKVKFNSYALARNSLRHDKNRSPYQCSLCGKWHIGNIILKRKMDVSYKRRKQEIIDYLDDLD